MLGTSSPYSPVTVVLVVTLCGLGRSSPVTVQAPASLALPLPRFRLHAQSALRALLEECAGRRAAGATRASGRLSKASLAILVRNPSPRAETAPLSGIVQVRQKPQAAVIGDFAGVDIASCWTRWVGPVALSPGTTPDRGRRRASVAWVSLPRTAMASVSGLR